MFTTKETKDNIRIVVYQCKLCVLMILMCSFVILKVQVMSATGL